MSRLPQPMLAATLACALLASGQAAAQHANAEHEHHLPADTPTTQPAQPKPQANAHAHHAAAAATQDDVHAHHAPVAPAMVHGHMHHSTDSAGSATPRAPIPALTGADRAAAFPRMAHGMEHASPLNWRVLVDHFELTDGDEGRGQRMEGEAWFGTDTDRLWLRAGVERGDGRTHHADLELLYGRSVGPWWDVVAGLRRETVPGLSRTWGALGIQGMAPGRFEVAATAYVGPSGRIAAHVEAEYDLLLTNRLILQPVLGAWLHGDDDTSRGIGSGLSSTEAGVRLRYELHRQFAPYIGIVQERRHGRSADMRRANGGDADDTQWVAGIRWWF